MIIVAQDKNVKVQSKDMKETPIKRILVPIDGSEYSINAAQHAVMQAKLTGAEIIAVHVLGQLPLAGTSAMETYYGNVKMANAFLKAAREEASGFLKLKVWQSGKEFLYQLKFYTMVR